jgi:hypothetical protein
MSSEYYTIVLEKRENIIDASGNFVEQQVSYIGKQIPTHLKLEFEDQFGVSNTLRIAEFEIDNWLSEQIV